MEDKRIYTLAKEKPVAAVLKMGVPVTMGMMFMVVYNLVDTYFIGQLHDDAQLAATNLAYPIMMITIAISGIVGNGGASYIARCMGAGREDEARHTLTIGFEMIAIGSLLMAVLGILFLDPIVRILGAKDATVEYTKQYTAVMFLGSLFTMGNYAFGQLLRSEGSTTNSMVGMLTGTIMNIILDPIFIFTLKLQILGAAVATILGNAAGMAVFIYCYASKKSLLQPSVKMLAFDKRIVGEIMWVGIPHTLEQFFSTAAMIVNNNLAAAYGELTVAAMGISGKIMSFGSYIYQGIAAGCQPLMGYNYGAGNFKRLRQMIKSGIAVTTLAELGVMVIFGIGAPWFIGCFSINPEVVSTGTVTLRAAMWMLPFVGSTAIARNMYNSIGKPFYSFGITVVRQIVLYIPMLIIFDHMWGYRGLIHAQPVEEAVCMVFSLIMVFVTLKMFEAKEEA
ncbi:MAG: MATE family efflux transporter [Eubacteriales bacterium]|nr:MATE family efflux transporter [Eubacteriales bacterium]